MMISRFGKSQGLQIIRHFFPFFALPSSEKKDSNTSLQQRSVHKTLLSAADPRVPSKKILEINMPLQNPPALIK